MATRVILKFLERNQIMTKQTGRVMSKRNVDTRRGKRNEEEEREKLLPHQSRRGLAPFPQSSLRRPARQRRRWKARCLSFGSRTASPRHFPQEIMITNAAAVVCLG